MYRTTGKIGDTPTTEEEICLYCPLPKCPKSVCKRFREEKRNLTKKSDVGFGEGLREKMKRREKQ